MPFTLSDLRKWEKLKDIGKFQQILNFLDTDDYAPARILAVKALGRIRDPRTIETLLTAASDPVQEVKSTSLRVLGRWIRQDLNPFCRIVESETLNRKNRKRLIMLLVKLRSDQVTETLMQLLKNGHSIEVIQQAVSNFGAVEPFLGYTQSSEPAVRYAAITAINQVVRDHRVHQVYTTALTDGDVQVRALAESSLGDEIYGITSNRKTNVSLKDYPGMLNALIDNLTHEDFMVRGMAAYTLGTFRARSTLGLLIPLLNDPAIGVRRTAVFALSRMPDKRACIPLINLYRSEENSEFRKRIIEAVKPIKHDGVFPFLKEIIEKEESHMLRLQAIAGISRFDTPETVDILERVTREGDLECVEYAFESLQQLSDPRRVEILRGFIENNDKNLFVNVVINFAETLDKENALDILIRYLGRQTEEYYCEKTIAAITRTITPQTLEDLLANLSAEGSAPYLKGLAALKAWAASERDS